MSDACEAARTDLRNAKERQESAAAWVKSANDAVDAAEAEHRASVYDHKRAVTGAEAYEDRLKQQQGVLRAAEAELADAEATYSGSNREARIRGLAEDVRNAAYDCRQLQSKTDAAWANVADLDILVGRALSAVSTAKNKLSLAEDDKRGADSWVGTATRVVETACN